VVGNKKQATANPTARGSPVAEAKIAVPWNIRSMARN
jgi:hypothetical protein